MVDRVQLTDTVYMPLDGQWQIVLSGSIVDVPTATAFSSKHVSIISPGEAAGTLGSHGKATSVRNVRTR